jgi:hypothetical protein
MICSLEQIMAMDLVPSPGLGAIIPAESNLATSWLSQQSAYAREQGVYPGMSTGSASIASRRSGAGLPRLGTDSGMRLRAGLPRLSQPGSDYTEWMSKSQQPSWLPTSQDAQQDAQLFISGRGVLAQPGLMMVAGGPPRVTPPKQAPQAPIREPRPTQADLINREFLKRQREQRPVTQAEANRTAAALFGLPDEGSSTKKWLLIGAAVLVGLYLINRNRS